MQLSQLQNNISLLFPFHFLACNLFALERETCACIFAVSSDLFKSNDRARVDAARIERVSGVTLGSEKSRCGRSGTIAFYRAGSPIFSLFLSLSFFRSVYTPTLRVSAVFPPCVPPISVAVVRDEFATRITEISASTGGYRSSRSFSLPSFYYPNPRSLSSRIPPLHIRRLHLPLSTMYTVCFPAVSSSSLILIHGDSGIRSSFTRNESRSRCTVREHLIKRYACPTGCGFVRLSSRVCFAIKNFRACTSNK